MDFLTIRMLDFSKPFIASPPLRRGGNKFTGVSSNCRTRQAQGLRSFARGPYVAVSLSVLFFSASSALLCVGFSLSTPSRSLTCPRFLHFPRQRQRRLILDLLQREARADVAHTRYTRQKIQDEMLDRLQIGHDHTQQIVGVAGHQIALHDFGPIANGTLEGFQ